MLSIIIPVYNSEKYLRSCIESVIYQSYHDIEIILVDNNSTDGSLKICQEYAERDKRIRLLSEKKKGAAAARNCGIRVAAGDYITFVDSDDYIRNDAYKILTDIMEENNCDIVCFSFNIVDENGLKLDWYEPNLKRYTKLKCCYTGIEIAKIFLTSRDIEGFGWNKIFKRSFIEENGILYDESKKAYEDMAIFFEALLKADRVFLCQEKLYYYRQISSSLTHINYGFKDLEYDDSVNHIGILAERYGLINEVCIFKASRYVWSRYAELDNDERENIIILSDFLKLIWYILSGLKSEKFKTLVKATLIYLKS